MMRMLTIANCVKLDSASCFPFPLGKQEEIITPSTRGTTRCFNRFWSETQNVRLREAEVLSVACVECLGNEKKLLLHQLGQLLKCAPPGGRGVCRSPLSVESDGLRRPC